MRRIADPIASEPHHFGQERHQGRAIQGGPRSGKAPAQAVYGNRQQHERDRRGDLRAERPGLVKIANQPGEHRVNRCNPNGEQRRVRRGPSQLGKTGLAQQPG